MNILNCQKRKELIKHEIKLSHVLKIDQASMKNRQIGIRFRAMNLKETRFGDLKKNLSFVFFSLKNKVNYESTGGTIQ